MRSQQDVEKILALLADGTDMVLRVEPSRQFESILPGKSSALYKRLADFQKRLNFTFFRGAQQKAGCSTTPSVAEPIQHQIWYGALPIL